MKTLFQILLVAGLCAFTTSCQTVHEGGRSPIPGTFQGSGTVRLDVSTSRSSYRVGDLFEFTVTPSEDCHLACWVRDSRGKARRIFPNAFGGGQVFRGGQTARFPGSGDFQFRVAPPTGRETLIILASTRPIRAGEAPPARGSWLKDPATTAGERPELRGEAWIVYEIAP